METITVIRDFLNYANFEGLLLLASFPALAGIYLFCFYAFYRGCLKEIRNHEQSYGKK